MAFGGGVVVGGSQEELVVGVKHAQRTSPELKEAWHRYCDSYGGGVRDPSRQPAEFLQYFLNAAANPQAGGRQPHLFSGGNANDLLAQQVKEHQRSSPEARDMWHKYCDEQGGGIRDPSRHNPAFLDAYLRSAGVMPASMDMHAQSHHSVLVQNVKAAQRASDANKDAWHAFCDDQGGIRDPARHKAEVLEAFLANVGAEVLSSPSLRSNVALAPTVELTPEQAELVAGVKSLQKSSEAMREAWHAFCDNKGLGHRDPNRHPAEFLREFMALSSQGADTVIMVAGGPWDASLEAEGQEELVQRVKRAQRSSASWKELWHRLCDERGGGVRDPMKHDGQFLKDFLRSLMGDKRAGTSWEAADDSSPLAKRPRFAML